MKHTKILPILLALMLLFSLTAFAEESAAPNDAPSVGGTTYTVTYGYKSILYDGKEPADYVKGTTPDPCVVPAGGNHTVLNNPYRFRDYIFNGWTDENGKKYAEGEIIYNVNGNIKLTATWKRGDEATLITYGRLSYGNGKEIDVQVGTTVKLDSGTWRDSDGRYFDGGNSFLMSRHFATLRSATKPANLVTVSYEGNGVKDGMQCSFTIESGKSFTVDGCFATRDGYEFIGWKDSAGKIYLSGDSCKVSGNTTLTAQWQESTKPMPDYCTVNIKCGNGGTSTPEGKQTLVSGESIDITFTANKGYQLVSVKRDGAELGVGGTYTLVVTADTKIEASFAKLPDNTSEDTSSEESVVVPSVSSEDDVQISATESSAAVNDSEEEPSSKDEAPANDRGNAIKIALIIVVILLLCCVAALIVTTNNNNKRRRRRR